MILRVHLEPIAARDGSSEPLDTIFREFPAVAPAARAEVASCDLVIDTTDLRTQPSSHPERIVRVFDERHGTLGLRATPAAALDLLTRTQRCIERRNAFSRSPIFTEVLRRHRALHDLKNPLVRADYDHALDVVQWVLRLSPNASFSLQVAALFHDDALKRTHPGRSTDMATRCLVSLDIPERTRVDVAALVAHHERPPRPEETPPHLYDQLAALADADALSFFSLGSADFVDRFGLDHTQAKIRSTLLRMTREARRRLTKLVLRADVARTLVHCPELTR